MNKPKSSEAKLANTNLRTLWTETLVELLYEAVQDGWSDNALKEIVAELYNKGYKAEQLMQMLEKKIGPDAAKKMARFVI
jgi:methionine salvage enolase-phosphatase E1